MEYRTFTCNQSDDPAMQLKFQQLQLHSKEFPVKKCIRVIPGLVSHSFEFLNNKQADMGQSLFDNSPVWVKHGLKYDDDSQTQLQTISKGGTLTGISFGHLISTEKYLGNRMIESYNSLQWKTDVLQKYLLIKYGTNEMRLTQDCLDKYFVVSNINSEEYIIILPLKASPRCYSVSEYRGRQNYKRTLNFDIIDSSCLANSSALCLKFHNRNLLDFAEFLCHVIKLDCHTGFINCIQMAPQINHASHILSDFWSNYACQTLFALGDRIKCQITPLTFHKISQLSDLSKGERYPNHQCYLKLMAIYYRARHNRFFDINQEFDRIQPIPSSIMLNKWEYVPRVYLTPYGIFPLPIKPMRGNRILRERQLFGPAENFCRVIFRDVDLGQPQRDFMQLNKQWILDLITANQYIIIGNQPFHFLLCSNSQLRDRSFWFHAFHNGCGAEYIREWMGDFTSEMCIGTRIARMALSLTGTTATIKLSSNQMELIADILDEQGRNFTDGVGKISPRALREALKAYNPELIEEGYMPSVIQARLNGIKGVFVCTPDLYNRDILIQYRNSQHKFKVEHNVLEVVKHSVSGMAFLNRQVIMLLENMGVKQHIFLKLQNKARLKISMSLLANKSALQVLEQHIRSFDWERMLESGIQLTREPFVRSLLLLLAQEKLKRLKERSHVQIPLSDGRMLLGVVDETNSLEYGQVFIQLRDLNGKNEVIKNRKILITKNPAHFPGDVRKLDAVDCPALHHLFECVVFPAKGPRPHPNEISGSDLDGDEYWACWNEELVNNASNEYSPAEFDSAGKTKHNGEITMMEIADFLFKYLSSDSLGALSNRHLVCCAHYGPNHEFSCRLAEIISQAVDFPKTGILPKIPSDIKLDHYPDFMENKHKLSIESNSSIGIMYRQVKEVWKIHSTYQNKIQDEEVAINPDFIIQGYEEYFDEATDDYSYYTSRMSTIVSNNNLENEYELITGCHSCAEEEKQNNDSAETALLEFRQLIKEMRIRFATKRLSYKEKLCKASAWYYVAYKAGVFLSFGWIMDRFMSDIMRKKKLPQEEHQALKRIGEAIKYDHYLAFCIRNLAVIFNIENEECKSFSETEKLGFQMLKIIDQCKDFVNEQNYAHKFLIFLHEVALNI